MVKTPNKSTIKTEYYNYIFSELEQEIGYAAALKKVEVYQKLSKQYRTCESWPIHNCKLLTTYNNPGANIDKGKLLLDRQCSVYYSPVTNKTHRKDLTIRQVADLIKSDTFEPETYQLRSITDKKENRQFKQKKFCYATFSGTFSYCADINLIQHSGLICIDVDHLGSRLPEVQSIINTDPSTVMSFVSPNGDGLKVLYEMNASLYTQEQYYRAYSTYITRLCNLEPTKIDQSCKNVSRACFPPCDPSLYINPHFESI